VKERALEKLPNTASRLIALAVSLIGGATEVMKAMGCSAQDFQAYCSGQKEPTWPEIDRLTALIVREQERVIAQNREAMAKARGDRPLKS
jgi:hypothetical protein